MPVVLVDRELPNIEVDAVLTDNRYGGYLATRHLIELGHQRIACITGPSIITTSAERVDGYRQALEESSLPYDESLILRGDYLPSSGLFATTALLDRAHPPTAVFALNDLMAVGALRAAIQRGCRVPEDLAVIGYDDIELACFTNPPLTTIAQPKHALGSQAASLLAERIAENSRPSRRLVIPPVLIVRESTLPSSLAEWSPCQ
jgi:LacI family transcriptional regulator